METKYQGPGAGMCSGRLWSAKEANGRDQGALCREGTCYQGAWLCRALEVLEVKLSTSHKAKQTVQETKAKTKLPQ